MILCFSFRYIFICECLSVQLHWYCVNSTRTQSTREDCNCYDLAFLRLSLQLIVFRDNLESRIMISPCSSSPQLKLFLCLDLCSVMQRDSPRFSQLLHCCNLISHHHSCFQLLECIRSFSQIGQPGLSGPTKCISQQLKISPTRYQYMNFTWLTHVQHDCNFQM